MAEETKHTPTPWAVSDKCVLTDIGDFLTALNRGPVTIRKVCDCEGNRNYVSDAEAEANAEFIVRACNSHDELLEALTSLANAVKSEVDEKGASGFLLARLADARAAISKATGK